MWHGSSICDIGVSMCFGHLPHLLTYFSWESLPGHLNRMVESRILWHQVVKFRIQLSDSVTHVESGSYVYPCTCFPFSGQIHVYGILALVTGSGQIIYVRNFFSSQFDFSLVFRLNDTDQKKTILEESVIKLLKVAAFSELFTTVHQKSQNEGWNSQYPKEIQENKVDSWLHRKS